MRDIELIFLILSLYNTNLGLSNSCKNEEQQKTQKEIMDKLTNIESMLKEFIYGQKT